MDKPKSWSELKKLLGRECVIEHQMSSNNVTGKITGISVTEADDLDTGQMMWNGECKQGCSQFTNVWVMIGSRPKTYPYTRIKLIEEKKKWWEIWK